MPVFLKISRHSPEHCPLVSETAKKLELEVYSKLGELAKKHGVKVVGGWGVMPEHLLVMVYEAPNAEAIQKLTMEPLIAKWLAFQDTTEFKMAMTTEECMKFLK